MVSIVLNGLPSSYKNFLKMMEVANKLEKLSFDNLSTLLKHHDTRFGKQKASTSEGEFFITSSSRGIFYSKGQGRHQEASFKEDFLVVQENLEVDIQGYPLNSKEDKTIEEKVNTQVEEGSIQKSK